MARHLSALSAVTLLFSPVLSLPLPLPRIHPNLELRQLSLNGPTTVVQGLPPAAVAPIDPSTVSPTTDPAPSSPASPDPSPIHNAVITTGPTSSLDPTAHPPFKLYSLLSSLTSISFLLSDPNPSSPGPNPNGPVRCSATFANDDDGSLNMTALPYDPQVCVDVETGIPSSTSLWAWQVEDYAGPGLFVLRAWRGIVDPVSGPCATRPDGTAVFCNTNYYAEHQIDASMGDVTCDTGSLSCTTPGVIEMPVYAATA